MLFIMAMRDPRDVAASRLHHVARTHDRQALEIGSDIYRYTVTTSAFDWNNALQRSQHFTSAHPDRVLVVRYEDMVAEPGAQLRRMFGFLGVDATEAGLAEIVSRASFETLSGRSPGTEDRASFYRKGVVGDWPSLLDADAVTAIATFCAEGMQRMGYV